MLLSVVVGLEKEIIFYLVCFFLNFCVFYFISKLGNVVLLENNVDSDFIKILECWVEKLYMYVLFFWGKKYSFEEYVVFIRLVMMLNCLNWWGNC